MIFMGMKKIFKICMVPLIAFLTINQAEPPGPTVPVSPSTISEVVGRLSLLETEIKEQEEIVDWKPYIPPLATIVAAFLAASVALYNQQQSLKRQEAFQVQKWFHEKYIEDCMQKLIAWYADFESRGFTHDEYEDIFNVALVERIQRIEFLVDTNILLPTLRMCNDFAAKIRKSEKKNLQQKHEVFGTVQVSFHNFRVWLIELQEMLLQYRLVAYHGILQVEREQRIKEHVGKLQMLQAAMLADARKFVTMSVTPGASGVVMDAISQPGATGTSQKAVPGSGGP